MAKERLLRAKCRLHGSDGCEVYHDNLASQKDRKRWRKASRAEAKREIDRQTEPEE